MNKNMIFNVFMVFNLLFVEISSYSDGTINFEKSANVAPAADESVAQLLQEIQELKADSQKLSNSINQAIANLECSDSSLDKILKHQDATEVASLNRIAGIEKTLHGIERNHVEILSSISKVRASRLKPFLLGSVMAAYLVYEYRTEIDSYISKLNEKLEAIKKQV